MYRAYVSFGETFFKYYTTDHLYLKFKENINHFFQLDLTPFEERLPGFIKKNKDENIYVTFLEDDYLDNKFYDSTSTVQSNENSTEQSDISSTHNKTLPVKSISRKNRNNIPFEKIDLRGKSSSRKIENSTEQSSTHNKTLPVKISSQKNRNNIPFEKIDLKVKSLTLKNKKNPFKTYT